MTDTNKPVDPAELDTESGYYDPEIDGPYTPNGGGK